MERSAWILLLVLAVGWGFSGRNHPVSVDGPQGSESGDGRLRRPAIADESQRPERGRMRSQSSGGTAARADSALGLSDPLQRMTAFTALVSSADKAGLMEIQEAFAKLRATGRRFPSEEKLLNFRAGEVDGAALLTSRSESSLSSGADLETVRPQFEGWLAADPTAAARWLDSMPQGKFRDQLVLSRIAAVAGDPTLTLELASSLHPSQQMEAGRTVARHLIETQSLDYAVTTLSETDPSGTGTDPTYMNSLFDSVVNSSLGAGEGKAAALIEKLADRPFVTPSTLAKVSASMAGKDPAAAFDWVTRMEQIKPDLNEGALLAATVSGVESDNIASAEQWTAAHSNMPGMSLLRQALKRRRDYLEDGGGGNIDKYDKDD